MILSVPLVNQKQAYPQVRRAWETIKTALKNRGALVLEVHAAADKVTYLQRRYYHGVVLQTIAEQARVNGQQFSRDTWKEHFRRKHLGTKEETFIDPLSGITYTEEVRVSTEDLKVRKYAKLIEVVTAEGVTDWGVRFPMNYKQWLAYKENNEAF